MASNSRHDFLRYNVVVVVVVVVVYTYSSKLLARYLLGVPARSCSDLPALKLDNCAHGMR